MTAERTGLDFYIERSSKKRWLCFDVEEHCLGPITEQLLATGLCVGKPGKSFRRAANKRLYEYYIEIKDAASADILERKLLNGGIKVTPAIGMSCLASEDWELTHYRGTFYVLLRGNEEACDGFLTLLDAADIRWIRARPPWNRSPWRERGFDWYILLDWDGDQENLERALEDAFRRRSDDEHAEGDGESVRKLLEINAQLKAQIEHLTQQSNELSRTLEVERSEYADIKQKLHDQTHIRIDLLSKHDTEVAGLKKRIRVLQAVAHPDPEEQADEDTALRDQIGRLEAELATKNATLDAARSRAEEEAARADKAEADLKNAQDEFRKSQAENSSQAVNGSPPILKDAGPRARRRVLDLLDDVLRGAFARLALDDQSLSVLADRAVEPEKFMRIVSSIEHATVRLERVRGTKTWQEVRHGGVMNSAPWRIYVKRKSDNTNGRKPVWIRQKKTQAQDIAKMKLED
jgi:hypothetical protein